MAPKKKSAAGQAPAVPPQPAAANAASSNGVLTSNVTAPGGAAVNKKKQKRRQKEAQKAAAQQQQVDTPPLDNPPLNGYPSLDQQSRTMPGRYEGTSFAAGPPGQYPEEPIYSDEEGAYHYDSPYLPPVNGPSSLGDGTNSKRKKQSSRGATTDPYDARNYMNPPPGSYPGDALRGVQHRMRDTVWDTDSSEERKRIKQFWLDLPEDRRRSLVNIEKKHVLAKMKEQQKHSCSCTVCGRKRTAIEEELEVLYAEFHDDYSQLIRMGDFLIGDSDIGHTRLQDPRIWEDPTNPANASNAALEPRPSRSRITELSSDDEGVLDGEDEGEYSDDDYDEDYSSDGADETRVPEHAPEFFQFGSSLTVKDGILTVAEDLLKNDGQKFIDMMEMLAEKRIQREEDARYGHSHYAPQQPGMPPHPHAHPSHLPPDEEDDYDDEDEGGEYSDEEEYEEDEMDALTEDQRMEEGRRMFQIFAARMFEQRVVQAYKEKVAEQRQQQLIRELEEGDGDEDTTNEKRTKAAEKKKRQREKAKEQKAAKDAAKEEEKKRREAALREVEEKKKEEQRQKQEEARKRKEAEKEALAEKKRRKDEEAQKRLEEQRERQAEQERKAREQKAEEKRKREEAERKRREEKETREKETRERRAQAEKEREAQAKSATSKARDQQRPSEPQAPDTSKLPTAMQPAVALPPSLKSRASYAESPQAKVATPALPKAPTPARQQQPSSRHTSTPHTPERTPQSKISSSPKSNASQPVQLPIAPPSRQSSQQYPFPHQSSMSPMRPMQPPPGMSLPPGMSMPGMQPISGFQGQQMRPGMGYGPPGPNPSMYSQGYPQQRPFMPNAPPGMPPPGMQQQPLAPGYGAFGQQQPQVQSQAPQFPTSQSRDMPPLRTTHSRQPSAHADASANEHGSSTAAPAPISRPAPIKRPASTKPGQDKSRGSDPDVEGLSNHLGSSALLDDTVDTLPKVAHGQENRRPSAAPGPPGMGAPGSGYAGISSPYEQLTSSFSSSRQLSDNWARTPFHAPGLGSGWGQQPGWGGHNNPSASARLVGPRRSSVRTFTSQACRFLVNSNRAVDAEGYVDFNDLAQHTAESARRLNMPPVQPQEIEEILDVLGDNSNGGGEFRVRRDGNRTLVKWEDDRMANGPPGQPGPPGPPGGGRSGLGLGGIGSPKADSSFPHHGGLRGF